MTSAADPTISAAERAFYVQEFARATLVVAMAAGEVADPGAVERSVEALAEGSARLVLVVGADDVELEPSGLVPMLDRALPSDRVVMPFPDQGIDAAWMADLWLAALDNGWVAVTVPTERRSVRAAELAAALRAIKLVVTDEAGGWGRPPRSFADVRTHREAYRSQLGDRQGGAVVEAIEIALSGGVTSVNLCRARDLDRELFTFDGTGTLFTSGGYVELAPLSIDDLAAVEGLVEQGMADGVLRPRSRREVARLAVSGLGAKVVGSGHLAGIVGLETDAYVDHGLGEVAGLYTVSRFSGSGAGGLLVDGLVDRARDQGLRAVFAVTVSEAAAEFFVRRGFREVARDEVPAVKWVGYDPERLSAARVFWRDTVDEPVF